MSWTDLDLLNASSNVPPMPEEETLRLTNPKDGKRHLMPKLETQKTHLETSELKSSSNYFYTCVFEQRNKTIPQTMREETLLEEKRV